ncbi:MAG: Uma2 family endonuclease [Bacteroidota bacterium]
MAQPLIKDQTLSYPEFQALETDNPEKRYEFYDGKVWEMEATTIRHNFIVRNTMMALDTFYRPSGCRAITENVRFAFEENKYGFYPDVMVVCNFNPRDSTVTNPLIIVEVLSEATSSNDLGSKLDAYQRCPSLKAYIIVEQKQCWVRVYEKPGDFWQMHSILNAMGEMIVLESLGLTLSLEVIYQDIEFDEPSSL